MALRDITRREILAALAKRDELGSEAFLEHDGFGPARSYYLVHVGKSYDSKAIVGAAHGFLPGRSPLRATEFSGGEQTVARLLRRLGFEVTASITDDLTTAELVDRVTHLKVSQAHGRARLYQPLTLLWAVGRMQTDAPEWSNGLKPSGNSTISCNITVNSLMRTIRSRRSTALASGS